MKITTNYQLKDWIRFVSYWMFMLVMITAVILIFMNLFFFPMIDEWGNFVSYIGDNDIVADYVEFTAKDFIENDLPEEITEDNVYDVIDKIDMKTEILLTLWGIVLFSPFLVPIWLLIKLIKVTIWFLNVTAERLDMKPIMKLVVFKNGKVWK